ncbi:MAG: LytR family transcriptional regulator [Chloroflexi bacterium]|nr:LytR family transcriptional regulator [Chloroflexota bacterium]
MNILQKLPIKGRPSIRQIVFWSVALVLSVALFTAARGFIGCWSLTPLQGIPLPECAAQAAQPSGTPGAGTGATPDATGATPELAAPELPMPEPWDGASRVTILIIGLDYGDWSAERDTIRSDTMILLTIDPLSKTAGMLSIPRDLWVNIPGFEYGKINTAYALGEAYKLPGLGRGLAEQTIESLLGIEIHYYAQIDFSAFERMIDEIGGVVIEVTETLELDPVGHGYDHVTVEPGVYALPGDLALAYARLRIPPDYDVGRARRQQQVILAIRDRLLQPGNLPNLVARAPALYQELSAGIKTNLPLDDALRLAVLASQIDLENIERGVFDFNMASPGISPDGLEILVPNPDLIRTLRDEIFTSGSGLTPLASGDPLDLMKAEAARVQVLNGTFTDGLATTTQEFLISLGMNVTGTGNPAERPGYTLVIDHTGKPYTVKYLMTLMNLTNARLRVEFNPAAEADVVINLGDDWAANNPMP